MVAMVTVVTMVTMVTMVTVVTMVTMVVTRVMAHVLFVTVGTEVFTLTRCLGVINFRKMLTCQ